MLWTSFNMFAIPFPINYKHEIILTRKPIIKIVSWHEQQEWCPTGNVHILYTFIQIVVILIRIVGHCQCQEINVRIKQDT